MPHGHGGHHHHHHNHHHHHHPGGVPTGVRPHHYGHGRGGYIGSNPYMYRCTMSKASIKYCIIAGVVLLIVAVFFVLFGGLLIGGVFTEGDPHIGGIPLLVFGIISLMTGLALLRVSCVAVPKQSEVCPEQAIDQVYGQSTTNNEINREAFPANPFPPPPFEPAVQPFQSSPYTWSSPAPFGGAPGF